MALTFNAKTFTADSYQANSVDYVGPAKTLSIKDNFHLARVAPKPTSVFSGVARSKAKLVRTLNLTGALTTTGDIIVDINISAPVGAASADVDGAVNDAGSFLSGADAKTLAKLGKTNY